MDSKNRYNDRESNRVSVNHNGSRADKAGSWRSNGAGVVPVLPAYAGHGRGYAGKVDKPWPLDRPWSISQRKVVRDFDCHENIDAPLLTSRVNKCNSFSKLREFFDAQNEKPYFNFIHASAFFSKLVEIVILLEDYEVREDELVDFKETVCLFIEGFNARTFSNVANDGLKLLKYAQKKKLKETEVLAEEVIAAVFRGLIARNKGMGDFNSQGISNIANVGLRYFNYGNKKQVQVIERLAINILRYVNIEVNTRADLGEFSSQALVTIARSGVKVLRYIRENENELQEIEAFALNGLLKVFQEVDSILTVPGEVDPTKKVRRPNPQDLAGMIFCANKLFQYAHYRKLEDLKEKVSNRIRMILKEVNSKKDLSDFNFKDFVEIACVLVKSYSADAEASNLLDKIAKCVCSREFPFSKPESYCALAWLLSIGGKLDTIFDWLQMGLKGLDERGIKKLDFRDMRRLYQVFLKKASDEGILSENASSNSFLENYLSKDLCRSIYLGMREEVVQDKEVKISQFRQDVGEVMQRIFGANISLKQPYLIWPCFVDIGILKEGELIGYIAINRQGRFIENGDYDLFKKFNNASLQAMGYSELVNIDYHEWDLAKLKGNEEAFLRQKVSDILNLLEIKEVRIEKVGGGRENLELVESIPENLDLAEQNEAIQEQIIEKTFFEQIGSYAMSLPAIAFYLFLLISFYGRMTNREEL